MRGLDFVDVWFGAPRRVPPDLTRLYQLLLNIITMKGTMPVRSLMQMGYPVNVLKIAIRKRYVKMHYAPRKVSEEVMKRILDIVGEAPSEMLV